MASQLREREVIISGYNGKKGAIHTEKSEMLMLGVNTATEIQRYKVEKIILGLMRSETPLKGRVAPQHELSQWARDEGFTGIIFPDPEYNFP